MYVSLGAHVKYDKPITIRKNKMSQFRLSEEYYRRYPDYVKGDPVLKYKLMIKQHWETGINYLCITKRDAWEEYQGSGRRWQKLLQKYPSEIRTWLIYTTDSKEDLAVAAEAHSLLFDIPNNPIFANLVPELGYEGNQGNLAMWVEYIDDDTYREVRSRATEARKATCLERFGVDHSLNIAREAGAKKLEELGYTSWMQVPGIAEKQSEARKKTLLERYGVENNMQIPGLSEKVALAREKTMSERYGVEYPLQIPGMSELVRTKREATLMEKYGVPNISMVPEIVAARSQKISDALRRRAKTACRYCSEEFISITQHENRCPLNPNRVQPPDVECPHCKKSVDLRNAKRWHFDNCKQKEKQQ